MNTLDILFAICICVMAVMAVLFVGSLWMQARNNAVYSFRGGSYVRRIAWHDV